MSELGYYLSLNEVCQCVRLSADAVITVVEYGIVEPAGDQPEQWQFEPHMVDILRRASRLQRDLELDWSAIALALNLIEEVEALRADNHRLRQQLARLTDSDGAV